LLTAAHHAHIGLLLDLDFSVFYIAEATRLTDLVKFGTAKRPFQVQFSGFIRIYV